MSAPPLRPGPADGRAIAHAVNRLRQGGLDVIGSVELAADRTETELRDSRISGLGLVLLMAETEAAAQSLSRLHVRIEGRGRAVIVHPEPAAGRCFRYAVLG
ncbi:MAG: hypothetical protein KIT20_06690 [Alphaproteobacteria bacterium]|nr:hypothetical protein [Alphaproteobacteria bacterium]